MILGGVCAMVDGAFAILGEEHRIIDVGLGKTVRRESKFGESAGISLPACKFDIDAGGHKIPLEEGRAPESACG